MTWHMHLNDAYEVEMAKRIAASRPKTRAPKKFKQKPLKKFRR